MKTTTLKAAMLPYLTRNSNNFSILGIRARFSFNLDFQRNIILYWAKKRESRVVCCANSHMLVLARESRRFREVLSQADLITLDGRPITWLVQIKNRLYEILGYSKQNGCQVEQVCGRDLMDSVLEAASENGISVGLYGNRTQVLEKLVFELKAKYPRAPRLIQAY